MATRLKRLVEDVDDRAFVRAYMRLDDPAFDDQDQVFEGRVNMTEQSARGSGYDVPPRLAHGRLRNVLLVRRDIEVRPGEVRRRFLDDWVVSRQEPASARPWEDPMWLLDTLGCVVEVTYSPSSIDGQEEWALLIDVKSARRSTTLPLLPGRGRIARLGRRAPLPNFLRGWMTADADGLRRLRHVWPEESRWAHAIWRETRIASNRS